MKRIGILFLFISVLVIWQRNLAYGQCAAIPIKSLVINGDFEKGNTGFISGYSNCNTANCLYPEGYYAVGRNANFYHGNFTGLDHTTGSGRFMIVNGAGVANIIIWSQTITVKPNTNYSFSAWVMSCNPSNPAALQFSINGGTIGSIFNAPLPVATWQNFAVTWNSGPSTSAVITILNQNTILNGNDFGLDDISFVEICPTPQPDLGPDRTLCGVGSILLNTNIPHNGTTSVTWSDGTTGTGAAAPYTHTVNAGGKYWVCVQDGSCIKTDTLLVIANFSIDLGPDVILCLTTAVTLDAGYGNATSSYKWYKDGVLLPDSTKETFMVTAPGLYEVDVFDASCGVTRIDQVTVSSTSAIPVDGKFCPPAPAVFSVLPNPTGGFKWYDAAVGGSVVGKGNTISISGMKTTTTMYAEDTSAFQYTVGPNTKFADGFAQQTSPSYYVQFDAFTSFTLNAVTVFAKIYNPYETMTIGVTLRDNTGAIQNQILVNVVGPPIVPANHDWPFTVNINMPIPTGTGWRLTNEGTIGDLFWASGPGNNVTWASYKIPGIIAFTGMDPGYTYCVNTASCFPYFYSWVISKGTGCARVPVREVLYCALPVEFISFEASLQNDKTLLSWVTATELNASHFNIERSYDGIHYQAIGSVKALGNSSAVSEYTFTDKEVFHGRAYYRIAEYDLDGRYKYTDVRTVERSNGQLSIYPNPGKGIFTLNYLFTSDMKVKVRLVNMIGQEVKTINLTVKKDQGSAEIDITELPEGVYMLSMETPAQYYSMKCVKE